MKNHKGEDYITMEDFNQIEKVRRKNNKNWMDLLRISFKHDHKQAKIILKNIFLEDKKINRIVKKITK